MARDSKCVLPLDLPLVQGPKRYALLVCGWTNLALAVIGALLPVMPSTVFLIIAAWAFSRSSPKCQRWLYTHPKWGPVLVAWRQYHVIPPRAKCLAVGSMVFSFGLLLVFAGLGALWLSTIAFVLALVASFILTRPSRIPAQSSLQ